MSSTPNAILAMDMLIRSTEYMMKLQQVLARAQAEGRDITEDELQAIRAQNLRRIDDLLSRSN